MKRCTWLFSLLLLLAIGGCRSAVPLVEVNNAPFLDAAKNTNLNLVTQAILEAGKARKFRMQVIEPGHIEAVYVKRDVRAVMDIRYTAEDFSITYRDSSNLNYNRSANTISAHYNKWVSTLKNDISNIYPLATYSGSASQKNQDSTSAQLIPPKPELTDSM